MTLLSTPSTRRAVILGGLAAAGAAAAAAVGLTLALPGRGERESPASAATPVDTLDFFLKKRPEALTGSHLLSQLVDRANRRSYYLKGDGRQLEVHTWDDRYIYLALDYDPERTYGLTPGVWLARTMAVGDEIVVAGDSWITWYDSACAVGRAEGYNYTIKLEQRLPAYDAGGDLGRQDVIVVRYWPAYGRAERFYYSREWGWIGWEQDDEQGAVRHRSVFNKIIRDELTPALPVRCEGIIRA